jgi:hypothetical protein
VSPVQDASPTLNDRLSQRQITELPQTRRDFTQLLLLEPGFRTKDPGVFSFNGLAEGGSTVTVDGVDGAGDVETSSTSMYQGFNYINVLSQEAISEVVYLNRAAFALVPVGSASGGTLRPGTLGKNALLTPGRENWDISVAKSFLVRERLRFQLRGEAFNAFNTVNLGAPIADLTNASFGRILSVGEARRMQLNARFTF